MSKNIEQVFVANPITSNASTDLMYFGQSPYGATDDAAMTYANFSAQFGAPYTAAALTSGNDTNVTLTLGGTPATALLHAASITAGWTGQLSVARGGTGLAAITAHDLIIGNGTSAPNLLAPSATSGVPVISQGASADPVYGTAVVAGGGTGNTTFTAYSVICAGTTATGAFQNVSGVGTANQVLVSNGAGALPSWQSVPGVSPAALTKTDDTNVTLTLGGTPATALLQATSITAGWTGTLSGARGGTGVANTGLTINLGSATTGYVLTSDSSGNATWAANPGTGSITTINGDSGSITPLAGVVTINGGTTGLTTSGASHTLSLTGTLGIANGGTGVTGTPTNGQILIGTGSGYNINTLTASTGISIINGLGFISISTDGTQATTFTCDTGSATPSSGVITITGSTTGLTTTGSGSTISLGGTLKLSNGGTNANLTASNGGIFYSTATAGAILSGTATAQQLLMSGASTTPQWSTTTYPLTNAINTLLYASSANVMAALATANSAVLVTTSTGVPGWSGTMTNGQVIIGSTGATPTAATLTAGTGVSITNGAGSITISSSGAAPWVDQTSASVTMATNTGYTSDDGATLVTFTLPTTSAIGDWVEINGKGSGLWTIAQASGQQIHFGNLATTSGATGTLSSTLQFDNVRLRCLTANTIWTVVSVQGNLTVV